MRLLILLASLLSLLPAGEIPPMPWRVLCDPGIGVAVRYPYTMLAPDQSAPVLWRLPERAADGAPVRIRRTIPDLRVIGLAPAQLAGGLDAAGDAAAGAPLAWTDYAYAAPGGAPWRASVWAPAGVSARLGSAGDRSCLVLAWGGQGAAIVLAGPADAGDNRRIIDLVEILVASAKGVDKPSAAKPLRTWREHQFALGKVMDGDGRPAPARAPVLWPEALEIETPHYHVTALVPPARLIFLGRYLEALYRAYAKLYQPETMPPYKIEVHVFDTYERFLGVSGAWGGPRGAAGGILGGFFMPAWLSLWVYEESGKLGGKDFAVEHVIAHECSHQFLHLSLGGSDHVPTWVNEALAVHFESGVFENGEFRVRPPAERIERLKQLYRQTGRPVVGSVERYLDHRGGISADSYGEVYAMVHGFVFGQPKRIKGKTGLDRFQEYMRAMRSGEDGAAAFERIFLADMIAAKGGRAQAIAEWDSFLVSYVLEQRNW